MTDDERAALKVAFPNHCFLRVVKDGWQALIALPKQQSTPEKRASVELWHKATARLQ